MIYLVEDDTNIRELVTYTLNHSGLDATGFERPSQFWKAMEQKLPDLVLLDIMLPEEDGLSILRRLRAAPATASIPILLDELNRGGALKSGEKLVLAGFGGGLTWGAAVTEWQKA